MPKLDPVKRSREYDKYSHEKRSLVVQGWLMEGKTHRELDRDVLDLDRKVSKGWQSMGILHFLGLKKPFRALFKGRSTEYAIKALEESGYEHIAIYLKTEQKGSAIDDLGTPLPEGLRNPDRAASIQYTFKRDPEVRRFVVSRANGCCEYCGWEGFLMGNGRGYIEAHHIIALSEQGPDTTENVIGLCPNCHREAHYGVDAESLEEKFLEILSEI